MEDLEPTQLSEYLTFLEKERRLSPHTVKNYRRDLELLNLEFSDCLGDITTHDIRRLVATLHAKGRGGKTLSRALSAWRGYFNFLIERRGYKHNPCLGIRPPKKINGFQRPSAPTKSFNYLKPKKQMKKELETKQCLSCVTHLDFDYLN